MGAAPSPGNAGGPHPNPPPAGEGEKLARKASCTRCSWSRAEPRSLAGAPRCARCACASRAYRARRPGKRTNARCVAATLSASQPAGVAWWQAACAASHRYRSRLSAASGNTAINGGNASVCSSSVLSAARSPCPATFCSQLRGPPIFCAVAGTTRTMASPPPARNSICTARCTSSSRTAAFGKLASAACQIKRCQRAPTHSSTNQSSANAASTTSFSASAVSASSVSASTMAARAAMSSGRPLTTSRAATTSKRVLTVSSRS